MDQDKKLRLIKLFQVKSNNIIRIFKKMIHRRYPLSLQKVQEDHSASRLSRAKHVQTFVREYPVTNTLGKNKSHLLEPMDSV